MSQIMIENEVWQKYGTKGELWYSNQYVDWMYKQDNEAKEDGMMHLDLLLGLQSQWRRHLFSMSDEKL